MLSGGLIALLAKRLSDRGTEMFPAAHPSFGQGLSGKVVTVPEEARVIRSVYQCDCLHSHVLFAELLGSFGIGPAENVSSQVWRAEPDTQHCSEGGSKCLLRQRHLMPVKRCSISDAAAAASCDLH